MEIGHNPHQDHSSGGHVAHKHVFSPYMNVFRAVTSSK